MEKIDTKILYLGSFKRIDKCSRLVFACSIKKDVIDIRGIKISKTSGSDFR